jgi:tetratricopeptide (TPR) repeat protein
MVRATLLAALAWGSPGATGAQPSAPATSLASYLQLVDYYRREQPVTAAYMVRTWLPADVSAATSQLATRFAQAAPPGLETIEAVVVEAAILMHTDAAAEAYGAADGTTGDLHLSVAQSLVRLLDDVSGRRGVRPAARRVQTRDWLLVAGSIKLQLFALDEAGALYRRALALAPNDPQVLLAMGGYYEVRQWHAAFSLAMQGRQPRSAAPDSRTAHMLDNLRVTNNLNEAARCLAQAVALDDGLHEARLRLARVEMLRGRRADADRLLAQVTARSQGPTLRYLAALLSARLREDEGAHDAALSLYRQAAELFPRAQTARMGLAHALERRGAIDDARTALGSLAPLPADQVPQDPWSVYRLAYLPHAAALLDTLRHAVRTP